jgi:hypothetical protein
MLGCQIHNREEKKILGNQTRQHQSKRGRQDLITSTPVEAAAKREDEDRDGEGAHIKRAQSNDGAKPS